MVIRHSEKLGVGNKGSGVMADGIADASLYMPPNCRCVDRLWPARAGAQVSCDRQRRRSFQ